MCCFFGKAISLWKWKNYFQSDWSLVGSSGIVIAAFSGFHFLAFLFAGAVKDCVRLLALF